MSKGFGKGTYLQIGDSVNGASTLWTTVAHLLDTLTGPEYNVEEIEDTDHQNATEYVVYEPGLVEGGNVSGKWGWDPNDSSHTLLYTLAPNRTKRDMRVVTPTTNSHYFQFVGFIKSLGHEFPYKQYMACNLSIRICGAITRGTNPS